MEHPEMRNTVFGQVVVELMESRGMRVTPVTAGKMAEEAGIDGWRFINRMADDRNEPPGHLDGLVEKLDLTEHEISELALAYAFEDRRLSGTRRGSRTGENDDR